MNTALWILLLLSCQTASASLFGDFYSSMTNLKDSFSTLLTDVIVDVKKTIDCTILVVEQALNIQTLDPEFARRCKGELEKRAKSQNLSDTSTEIYKTEERKLLENDLDESLSRVNKSICTMLEHRNLNNMKGVLENNTDHLFEIKILLKKELNRISDDIKNKLSKDLTHDDDASVDGVYNDLMILQEVKQMDDNKDDVSEIDIVLDDVYDILKINDESAPQTVKDEVDILNKDETVIHNDSAKVNQLLDSEMRDLQKDTGGVIVQTELPTTNAILKHTDAATTAVITTTKEVTTEPTTTYSMATALKTTTPCITAVKTTPAVVTTKITKYHDSKTTHITTELSTSLKPSTTESTKTTLPPLIKGLLKVPTDEDQKAFIKQAKDMMKKKKQAEMMMNMFQNGNVAPRTIFDLF